VSTTAYQLTDPLHEGDWVVAHSIADRLSVDVAVAVAMAELLRNSDAYTWSTSTSSTTASYPVSDEVLALAD
jgi:hypothetical protein